jgi:uncharacterized protein (TIGR03086 family)
MSQGSEVVDLYGLAVDRFVAAVRGVPESGWTGATPCADWDARTLTNHLVGEDLWVPPLVDGKTVAEVGDVFDGDVLGPDPIASAEQAGKTAVGALAEPGALTRTVHLSFGDFTAEEYAWQVLADHVVHTWDLLASSGGDRTLDDGLVEATAAWFANWEEAYRGAGAIGPAFPVGEDASAQDRLLASFGRDSAWQQRSTAT